MAGRLQQQQQQQPPLARQQRAFDPLTQFSLRMRLMRRMCVATKWKKIRAHTAEIFLCGHTTTIYHRLFDSENKNKNITH